VTHCEPEKVTGYVDDALDAPTRSAVEEHLAGCPSCRQQAEEERALRQRLRTLAAVALPPSLDFAVRRRLRGRRWGWLRVALPMAAGLAAVALWTRALPAVVAWELSLDHGHCFGKDRLPAQVWTSEVVALADWYRQRGTELPYLPESIGQLALIGGRFCPLADRRVAHVYFGGDDDEGQLSFYVVPDPVRIGGAHRAQARGRTVHLMRLEGKVVGLVSEEVDVVNAFERALTTTVAWRRALRLASR
jgi:hypothetical protein